MLDIASAIARAASRRPCPAAERSLAQARALRLRASCQDVPLPEPTDRPGLLRISPHEKWCQLCGETIGEQGYCHRCGSRHGRPASMILRPDEYYIAT